MSLTSVKKRIFLNFHQEKGKKYQVSLTIAENQLEFNSIINIKSTTISCLPWFYILNCVLNDTSDGSAENNCFTLSFLYPPKSKKNYYSMAELKFSIDSDCAQEAEFSRVSDVCQLIQQKLSQKTESLDSQKPYLLLVNPRSGTRKGSKIFNNCILKLFQKFNIQYELVMTEKPLHAKSFLKSCESLQKYRGIVTVSGDGLIYEVFCGIMERNSWKEDIGSIPIGVIPAGSGNGLAACISAFSGVDPRSNIILFNTLLLKNPFIQNLDLMKIQTANGSQLPSFLSLTWGLMAHVDVGSDKFRWMGHARFSVVAAIQVAKMNKYKGKLWYMPIQSDHANKKDAQKDDTEEKDKSFSETSFRYLPDISKSIPTNNEWVLLDQNFITIIVSLVPYIATDVRIAPEARINDGKIHIIIINPEISRSELINGINKLETGEHFSCKAISYIECVAFRLLPECDKCYMAVDGEYIENTAIQAEIMPSVARILTGPSVQGSTILS